VHIPIFEITNSHCLFCIDSDSTSDFTDHSSDDEERQFTAGNGIYLLLLCLSNILLLFHLLLVLGLGIIHIL
jgi:hypothetical protein